MSSLVSTEYESSEDCSSSSENEADIQICNDIKCASNRQSCGNSVSDRLPTTNESTCANTFLRTGAKRAISNEINKTEQNTNKSLRCKRQKMNTQNSNRLPVPDQVKTMFLTDSNTICEHKDDSSLHEGRIRSFDHERGNWASYLYLKFPKVETFEDLVDDLKSELLPLDITLHMIQDPHISLSKTLVLRHHWIDPLLESMTSRLKSCSRCQCDIRELKLYSNDEKTRTFFGLRVVSAFTSLQSYVAEIDQSLVEYKLPTYYKDPSFHMSIGWCHGDMTSQITSQTLTKLQDCVDEHFDIFPEQALIKVENVMFKAGNKTFSIPVGVK